MAIAPLVNTVIPMTSTQRHLWTQSILSQEGSLACNLCIAKKLSVDIDKNRLANAIAAAAAQQPFLNTVPDRGGQNLVVHAVSPPPLNVIRLGFSDAVIDHVNLMLCRPFDIMSGEVIRASIIEAPGQVVLLITLHHLIADGRGADLFFEQVVSAYLRGTSTHPDSPALGQEVLAKYAHWVTSSEVANQRPEQQKAWLDWAESAQQSTSPTFSTGVQKRSLQSSTLSTPLSQEQYRQATKAAANSGMTLFMLLCAAYAMALHRILGCDEIVIGVPRAAALPRDMAKLMACTTELTAFRSKIGRLAPNLAEINEFKAEIITALYEASGLPEALESGAIPNLSIDATITLERRTRRRMAGNTIFEDFGPISVPYSTYAIALAIVEGSDNLDLHFTVQKSVLDNLRSSALFEQFSAALQDIVNVVGP